MAADARQQRGQATRATILGVAKRLFSDFGYHHTGIADIQAATGLTKGAFYHHFRAKQELALAVLEVVLDDYGREVFGLVMDAPTPGKRLAALLNRLVELNERPEWQNCRLMATLFAEVRPVDDPLVYAVRKVQQELLDRITVLVGEAQASGEVCPGPASLWAQLILSTFLGLVLIRKTGALEPDCREVIGTLERQLFLDTQVYEPCGEKLPRLVRLPGDADCF